MPDGWWYQQQLKMFTKLLNFQHTCNYGSKRVFEPPSNSSTNQMHHWKQLLLIITVSPLTYGRWTGLSKGHRGSGLPIPHDAHSKFHLKLIRNSSFRFCKLLLFTVQLSQYCMNDWSHKRSEINSVQFNVVWCTLCLLSSLLSSCRQRLEKNGNI